MGRTALPFEQREFPKQGVNFHFWMVFVQWKKGEKLVNRGWLQKVRFCLCSDNPATGLHYSSVGQAERACRDLHDIYDDDYIPTIVEFGASQVGSVDGAEK